jgi:hypothetical protein
MNNKGNTNILYIITIFSVLAMIFMFMAVFVYEIGQDYIVGETANAGRDIINQFPSVNESQQAIINSTQSDYDNFAFPFDLFFFLSWLGAIALSVFSVFQANKNGIFSFFGLVFMATIILLLITTYISSFTGWFQTELFVPVFGSDAPDTPIFNWYITNLGIINLIWWIILVCISVIDRNFISRSGQVEE